MCVGTIARLVAVNEEAGVRTGELDNGMVVPLAFVPDACVGRHLLLHLGIPVGVLEPEAAREALCLRAEAEVRAEAENRAEAEVRAESESGAIQGGNRS